ncbi:hypothetical protein [Embleya sp. NPDC001921]
MLGRVAVKSEEYVVAAGVAAVHDAADAWGFVTRFVRDWLDPLRPGDGCADAEIAAAEHRLGLRLPDAVAACYRLLGHRDDLTSVQDQLLSLDQLCVEDDVLVYRVENRCCAEWGVPVARLADADPPVVFRLDGTGRMGWRPFLDRFSLAAIEMVLSEAVLSADGGVGDNRELDAASVAVLRNGFQRIGFPDYPMWAIADGPPVRWFTAADVILRDDAQEWLWVLSRTIDGLDAVRAQLPGEWNLRMD